MDCNIRDRNFLLNFNVLKFGINDGKSLVFYMLHCVERYLRNTLILILQNITQYATRLDKKFHIIK